MSGRWRRRLAPVGFGLVVLLVWQLAAVHDPTSARLVPGPAETARAAVVLAGDPDFWQDVAISLRRMVLGFATGVLVAVPLGVCLAVLPLLRSGVRWLVDALRYTPVTAFIPLLLLFLGVGETHMLSVVALGTVPYLALLTASAVVRVPVGITDSARTYGVPRWTVVRRFALPHAAPEILVGLRVSLALAWTYLLTAELVGAAAGLGRFLLRAQRFLRTDEMLVAVVVIGTIGWASDAALRLVERYACPWAALESARGVAA